MNIHELMGRELPEFEVIDIHAHMNRPAQFMCPGDPDIDGMIAVMDRVGINRIAIMPNMAINCDVVLGNRMVLEAARKYPARVIGVATVNFNFFEESLDSLGECFATSYFKGVKMHPDFMHYSVQDGEKMRAVLDFAKAHNAFLISHTDSRILATHLVLYSDPAWFEPYIRDYPEVNFILAHCGLGPEGFDTSLRLAQKYANVFLDTTGFRFSNTWTVERVAREAGPEKIVFGTDMPFNDVASGGARIVMADLPAEQRIMMMGRNAKCVLKEV